MIKSRADYKAYLEADRIALYRTGSVNWLYDEVWMFQRALRKVEYLLNCKDLRLPWWKVMHKIASWNYHKRSVRCGVEIPPNTFGKGLSISHRGTIIVNSAARIGENCRIHVDVVIGTRPGLNSMVPMIGNNCYIGPGAKIFGNITLGDNMVVGANSVVHRSFPEGNITIAGAPATKVSDTTSTEYIFAARKE